MHGYFQGSSASCTASHEKQNRTGQNSTEQNERERERGRERTSDEVLRSVKRIIILIKIDDFDDATLDMDLESLNAT